MDKKYSLICCINEKFAIGRKNKLLYRIKNDLKNFKSLTLGNVVIMGRKTFESLPKQEPLKGRVNIILTSDESFSVPFNEDNDVYIVHSWESLEELCNSLFSDKECFIIGGASVYEHALTNGMVDKVYLTTVHDDADGDVYLKGFNESDFKVRYKSLPQTEKETFTFAVYQKD